MQMPPLPASPTDERRFLKNIRNHAEFRRNLADLSMMTDLPLFDRTVVAVTASWMKLADEHIEDAMAAHAAGRTRAAYSRAYYAAYNASKAIRYHVNGVVSLKGDDHQAAPETPWRLSRLGSVEPACCGTLRTPVARITTTGAERRARTRWPRTIALVEPGSFWSSAGSISSTSLESRFDVHFHQRPES